MRNPKVYIPLLIVFFLMSLTVTTHAQTDETLSPPVVRVELSRTEVLPPTVGEITAWGGYGGGGDPDDPRNAPHWVFYPDDIYNDIKACGFSSGSLASAVLELPGGKTKNLSRDVKDGCWSYSVAWEYGMELGEYSLALDTPEGSLEHHWTIGYPDSPTLVCFPQDNAGGTLQTLLMGFSPETSLTLYFYGLPSDFQQSYKYVSSRTVKTDEHGAVMIDVSSTRSSGYADSSVGITIEGYEFNPRVEEVAASSSCDKGTHYNYWHLYGRGQSAPDSTAEISQVWVDRDIVQDNLKGMRIHVAFDANNFRGKAGQVNVYFYHADGEALKDFDGRYHTTDGHIAASGDFIPPHIHSTYSDFTLFMPYRQLHLSRGPYDLMFRVAIWGGSRAVSPYSTVYFTYASSAAIQGR